MPEALSYSDYYGSNFPAENVVLQGSPTYGDTVQVFNGSYVPAVPDFPIEADVRLGVQYDSGNLTGTLDLPATTDVRLGVEYDNTTKTGQVEIPVKGRVIDGVTFDVNNVGTFVYPLSSQVQEGVQYGADGTEFIGTFRTDPAIIPDEDDVRFGVAVGDGTGNLELPEEPQVLIGVGYGSRGVEFTGSLTDLPGGTVTPMPPVMGNGEIRSPLIVGNAYVTAHGTSFVWLIDPVAGMTTGDTVYFRGWNIDDPCKCDDAPAWEVTGTITGTTEWTLEFEITSAESTLIPPGDYVWRVEFEKSNNVVAVASGDTYWIC